MQQNKIKIQHKTKTFNKKYIYIFFFLGNKVSKMKTNWIKVISSVELFNIFTELINSWDDHHVIKSGYH